MAVGAARSTILFGVLTVGASNASKAQDPTWEGAILLSRTQASVRFDANSTSNGTRMGFAPAAAVSRSLPFGAIRFEATLVKKGFERTQPTYHWTYLEFPILLEMRPPSAPDSFEGVVQAGLAPSFAVKCIVKYNGVQGPYRGDCEDRDPFGLLAPVSRFDLSWILGLGLRAGTGPTRFLIEIRATKGMTTVEGSSKHTVMAAGAGLSFALGR
jgi:hypothetical protein